MSKTGFPIVSDGLGGDMGRESVGLHTWSPVLLMSPFCPGSWYALSSSSVDRDGMVEEGLGQVRSRMLMSSLFLVPWSWTLNSF